MILEKHNCAVFFLPYFRHFFTVLLKIVRYKKDFFSHSLNILTCLTRFLLVPTLKMPTVWSPCNSKYLKKYILVYFSRFLVIFRRFSKYEGCVLVVKLCAKRFCIWVEEKVQIQLEFRVRPSFSVSLMHQIEVLFFQV